MDKQDLLALRAEFKELAQQPDRPWASRQRHGDGPHFWLMRGAQQSRFEGLAGRAAVQCGREGFEGWLDHLATATPLTDPHTGKSDDVTIVAEKLCDICQLSVEAIDALLSEPERTADTKTDTAGKNPKKKRKMSPAAAQCAIEYKKAHREGAKVPLKEVIKDHVAKRGTKGGKASTFAKILQDNPDQWKI